MLKPVFSFLFWWDVSRGYGLYGCRPPPVKSVLARLFGRWNLPNLTANGCVLCAALWSPVCCLRPYPRLLAAWWELCCVWVRIGRAGVFLLTDLVLRCRCRWAVWVYYLNRNVTDGEFRLDQRSRWHPAVLFSARFLSPLLSSLTNRHPPLLCTFRSLPKEDNCSSKCFLFSLCWKLSLFCFFFFFLVLLWVDVSWRRQALVEFSAGIAALPLCHKPTYASHVRAKNFFFPAATDGLNLTSNQPDASTTSGPFCIRGSAPLPHSCLGADDSRTGSWRTFGKKTEKQTERRWKSWWCPLR